MTVCNSSLTTTPTQAQDKLEQICSFAASVADMLDDGLADRESITDAQLVAMRALAGNIGALADSLAGGGFRGDAVAWMG
ncbi:hypothetical protein [Parahaliea mediterranea]|uniref:hypothetical protein n=1 Tax=Parahaliea mediterranea TaxID=651086 RepID=UPI000E2E9129|nr:hypothetical protein [Parahaliea mediterranea]